MGALTMAMEPGIFSKGNGAQAASAAESSAAGGAEASAPQRDDAQKAQIAKQVADVRHRIHLAVGQIVLALSAVPRYRHLSLADVQSFVLDPLLRDRIAIAASAPKDATKDEAHDALKDAPMAGVAIWASVSDEVDAKIREQIKAGVFPTRLKPEDWTSGDKAWLLDVIAPSQKLASAVLANFRQVVKEGDVRIHPIVGRMVDPELLKRLAAASAGAQEAKAE